MSVTLEVLRHAEICATCPRSAPTRERCGADGRTLTDHAAAGDCPDGRHAPGWTPPAAPTATAWTPATIPPDYAPTPANATRGRCCS